MELANAAQEDPQGDAPSNPAYITLLANYQQAQSEAESLLGLYRKQQEKLAEYQAVLDRTPLVEREYSVIMRDLEAARMRLAESGAKAEQARVGVMVVAQTRAQSFNLLEPPIAPTQPHWPNRWVLLFLGFAMSLFGTLAAAALAESVDDSVRSAKDVNEIIGGPPICFTAVPASRGETRARSVRRINEACSLTWKIGVGCTSFPEFTANGLKRTPISARCSSSYHFGVTSSTTSSPSRSTVMGTVWPFRSVTSELSCGVL